MEGAFFLPEAAPQTRPSKLPTNTPSGRRSVPETEGDALREMMNTPLFPPVGGRAENPVLQFVFVPLLVLQAEVCKTPAKEQFPQTLG